MGREGGRELPGGSSLCPGMRSALSIPQPSRQAHVMGSCWATDRRCVPTGEPHPGHRVLWSLSPLVTRSPCLVLEDPMMTGSQAHPDLSQPPHATVRSGLLVGYSTPSCREHAEDPTSYRGCSSTAHLWVQRGPWGSPQCNPPPGLGKTQRSHPCGERGPPPSSFLLPPPSSSSSQGLGPPQRRWGGRGREGNPRTPHRPGALCAPAPRSIALSPSRTGPVTGGDTRTHGHTDTRTQPSLSISAPRCSVYVPGEKRRKRGGCTERGG